MGDRLEATYRAYIDALNERRFADLDEFVHDRLTYNGEEWPFDRYKALLAEDAWRIPDLHYDVHLLITGADHVACRIWFDCTPRHPVLGIDASGRRVSFAEHVFYRFRDNRIHEVWSVIDTDGIRRHLDI